MVDKAKVEEAIKLLLEGIGEDVDREGLQGTPERIARMCEEIYGGLDNEADEHLQKQFHVENNEMVLEKDITFYSMCEHHLMPFYGKAHIAYIPNGKVTGLSKLARTVDVYARRPQIQERREAKRLRLSPEVNSKKIWSSRNSSLLWLRTDGQSKSDLESSALSE